MRILLTPILLLLTACMTTPTPVPPPNATYAWIAFDKDRILASDASGLADRATGRALTIDDPVRIASISKLVVALGVMRLVEQGRLDLDADVSTWLGRPLRNPAHPDTPVTLRLLLSHRSSLTDRADYVVPFGQSLWDTTAKLEAWDTEHAPGTYFRYTNLNFPVIAATLEKATGERFDRLMDRLVMKPLGLDACFNYSTCSDAKIARHVVLYDPAGKPVLDDLAGRRPVCPVYTAPGGSCDLATYQLGSNGAIFSPQGGLRISARDLARVGQLLLNRGGTFLKPTSIDEILRPHWTFDGSNGDTEGGFYCAYGLASQTLPVRAPGCKDDLFADGHIYVGHAGSAYGQLSGLWIDRAKGRGVTYFATNNGSNPPHGRTAYRAIEEWLAAASVAPIP